MATGARIALIPEEPGLVPVALLVRTAAAIDRQVREHLRPIWKDVEDRTVVACPTLDEVQETDWHVFLLRDDPSFDYSPIKGYHLDQAKPYAAVETKDDWQLIASHEILEMLVDPTGNKLMPGDAPPEAGGGPVQFLVEVCDPCETECYFLDDYPDVPLAYFYTPNYFDSAQEAGVHYAFRDVLAEPREVLPGGYLSWTDGSGQWFQKVMSSSGTQIIPLNQLSSIALNVSLRSQIDRFSPRRPAPAAMRQRTRLVRAARRRQQKLVRAHDRYVKSLRAHIQKLKKEARKTGPGKAMS